MHGVPEI